MPRLSIVIPCVEEAGCFEATLASVLQNRPDDCEILVVQPRDYDDPYELKEEVRFVRGPADSTLVDLINVGVEHAEGEIVHLLSCDVEVLDGWTQPVLQQFDDPNVGSVSPLVVAKGSLDRVGARGVCYGSGGVRRVCHTASARGRTGWRRVLAPTLLAGAYRRHAILEVGGFCRIVGAELADVDLGLMLNAAGYRCVHEEASAVTTDNIHKAIDLSMASGHAAECLFWRNTSASNWTCVLLTHPLAWVAECVCNLHRPQLLLQMVGRARGWLARSLQREHHRHLQQLQSKLVARRQVLPANPSTPDRSATLNTRAVA